jgi:phospholipid/cholesterol/gamma-HCH transport system substrate-binding protein
MTVARGLAVGALVAAVLVVGWLLLLRGGGKEYELRFANAGQIVKGDDVQVGGRRIGSVKSIALTNDNQAAIKITVGDEFAPLHQGTTALIRATSLSGVANRYIALTPGPNNAPKLDEGAVLAQDKTTSIVDLDQLFNTFDARTRKGLQEFIQGSATTLHGKGEQANAAALYFNPALASTRRLVNEVVGDQETLTRFLQNTNATMRTIASRRGALTDLVSNANSTAAAIGDENAALAQTLGLLPGTLRKANTTFVNLRATLDDLDVLVAESKPATKDLARFLRTLRPLLRESRPTIHDLSTLVHRPGAGNDLTDLLRQAPQLEKVARPAFANSTKALRASTPVLKFGRPYAPEIIGFLKDFGQTASNYDANGHFARISPNFNVFQVQDNPTGQVLVPNSPDQRLAGYQTGVFKRCPGSATQPAPDGSNPWRDDDGQLDCDPNLHPPGP